MILSFIEGALNRNIAASGSARALCSRLATKTLALHILGGPEHRLLSLYVHCDEHGLSLVTSSDQAATATLSGTPLAFLQMVRAEPERAMRSGSVRIEGDAEAAQTFRDLLQTARPEFEEELARMIGDVPAHQVGNIARGAFKFGQKVVDTLAQNVAEYLQEETRDLVSRIEVDEFVDDVDSLRDAVDRAEARMNALRHVTGDA